MSVIVIAVALRVWVSTFGNNFDLESYEIVAKLQAAGENVYAGTERYNYGPPWFLVLGSFWRIASFTSAPLGFFRAEIIALLTMVDLTLAAILYKRYGVVAGLIILFSPISIIITGYHNQFDNLAVLLGLIAVLLIADRVSGRIEPHEWMGILLLSLSLSVKHVLLVFPLWLALRQESWMRRLIYLVVPGGVFLLAFGPWSGGGGLDGILENVVGYRSFANAPIVATFVGGRIEPDVVLTLAMGVFAGALLAGAWWTRRLPLTNTYLVYLVVISIFAPALANQYFVIPLAAVAVFPNPLFFIWMGAASLFLVGDPDGLHSQTVLEQLPDILRRDRVGHSAYQTITWLLALGAAFWWGQSRYRVSSHNGRSSRDLLDHETIRLSTSRNASH